jgi:hypothetical protein|tara:strand:+ start:1105 stop:1821 length:717 start_codon:yes stop_codon:yes gene_type:complete
MGFLDNSTNNIIVDAVLTDRGRQFLSRNDGSFSILTFALCDDEVDYSIIKKYGITVGKEKITKNTPVMEAQTHGSLACKYKLLSLGNPKLITIPNLSLTLEGNGSILTLSVSSATDGNSQKQVTIYQSVTNQPTIPSELVDTAFVVKMDNRFITIPGAAPSINSDGIATYLLTQASTNTGQGGGQVTFPVATLPIPQYTLYSTYSNNSVIQTYITATGWNSGAEKTIEVQISNPGITT